MTNNMSTEETFRFIELYQAENCIWNPKNKYHKNKNVINDSWNRIADKMGVPVHELKKKKENLLATFRQNLKKKIASIKSGAGADEVYQPVWMFYDAMAAFLTDVYESTSVMNSEDNTQPVVTDETSNVRACDISPEAQGDDDDADVPATRQKNPSIQGQKRRAFNPPELQEASKKMTTALTTLNSALISKQNAKEEDQCDLFCRMLAKQIKEYPKLEREEIMYEIHGVMMNRRRRYNTMQSGSYTVSSPSQVVLSRPSTSNSGYISTPSPNFVANSPYLVESVSQNEVNQQSEIINILSQEIILPETSRAVYENFGNMMNNNN